MIDNSKYDKSRGWAALKRKKDSILVGVKEPNSTKRWDLLYRGEMVVHKAPYPVCVAKRNEKMAQGNHTIAKFEIRRSKQ